MKFRLLFWMRERPCRVETQRGQNRLDLVGKIRCDPLLLLRRPVVGAQYADSRRFERRKDRVVEQRVLRVEQLHGPPADRLELVVDVHAVRPGRKRAELPALLQARHANLEELVEVGAGDCQELDALEERHVVVLRLRQHAPVELEKGQLAVYEELGRL